MSIKSTKKEFKYFSLKSMANLGKLPNSLIYFSKVIILKLKSIFQKSAFEKYPLRLYELVDYINAKFHQDHINYENSYTSNIKFLSTSFGKIEYGPEFSWNKFSSQPEIDLEMVFSFNRWYFLIYDQDLVQHIDISDINSLIYKWICQNKYDNSAPQWESYSTSERISSFAIILSLKLNPDETYQFIKDNEFVRHFLQNSLLHLSNNLEYFSPEITFNHVLNDLKGILTIGILLNDINLITKTTDLILQELNEILDENGMLREGSSHYQFIITRWLVEVIFLLDYFNFNEFNSALLKYTIKAVSAAKIFVVNNSKSEIVIPLFGDVSPDFDPEWLLQYFQTINCNGNGNIVKWHYGNQVLLRFFRLANESNTFHNKKAYDSYTRIDKKDWILFVKHQITSETYFPNHSHDDYGSFVLFFKNSCILSDLGRKNYLLHPLSDIYCHVNSHNTISLNGLPVMLSNHFFYLPGWFKKCFFKTTFKFENEKDVFIIETNSISRFKLFSSSSHSRKFELSNSSFIISDELKGVKGKLITSNFHFNNNVHLKPIDNGFEIKTEDVNKLYFTSNISKWDIIDCFESLKYGTELKSKKIKVEFKSQTCDLRIQCSFKFT